MDNVTRNITWTLSNGKDATYIIELMLSKRVNLDGDISIVPCCEINTRFQLPGMGFISADIRDMSGKTPTGVFYVAVIGNKVAITEDIYSQIMTARNEIESHPSWIAKQETIARNRREIAEHEAKRKANGYCPKCHSYCYGDCEA